MRTSRLLPALLALALGGAATPSHISAQASPYLAVGDPLLDDLGMLAAQGLTDALTTGSGPVSRLEAARILLDAEAGLTRLEARAAASPNPELGGRARASRRLIDRLSERLRAERATLLGDDGLSRTRVLDAAELAVVWLDSPVHGYPNNFLGDVDATANPMAAGRQGRSPADGRTLALETRHALQPHPLVTLFVQPRLEYRAPRDGGSADATDLLVQQAYVRVATGPVTVTGGRADVVWGQGRRTGLMLSGNARSPWLVRAGTTRPVTLPGFLGGLGPFTAELMWADLGSTQNFPGADVAGYHLTARPHPRFEFGAGMITQFGGQGAPGFTFNGLLKDLALLLSDDRQFSNKLAGLDFRWRFPESAGLSIYGEIVADDIDMNPGRLPKWIFEDVGHLYGVELARLSPDGRVGAWAEIHHTGHRFYRHSQFTSGLTYDRAFLGHPLGPDGDGVYAGLRLDLDMAGTFEIDGAWERQSRDRYYVAGADDIFNTFPGDDGWSVYEDFPEERRLRMVTTWRRHPPSSGWAILARGGVERVHNFDYQSDPVLGDRTNFMAEVRVELRVP